MTMLIVVVVLILAGAVYLLRSDPPAAAPAAPVDAKPLRTALLASLADASPGWTWEEVEGEPLQLSGVSAANGERRTLDLSDLAQAWARLNAAGREADAARTIDAFTAAVVGGDSDDDGDALEGAEWALQALALRFDRSPAAGAITHVVDGRTFTLVVRQPSGPENVGAEDLEEWSTTTEQALARALENLAAQVADGVPTGVLDGTADEPDALAICPEDPLAASLCLAPGLGKRLEKALGAELRLWIAADGRLIATRRDQPPTGLPVVAGPLVPVAA